MDDFELKVHNVLKEDDVKNLEVISDEDFSDIVNLMFLNDYKNIPDIVRLPDLNKELSEKLGLIKETSFVIKKGFSHIRPSRKGSYDQVLSFDEYCNIPRIIREATFAVVDKRFDNFQIVFDDLGGDIEKINKIVFNKDNFGNYLVTVGKVDRRDAFSENQNAVVRVGVAPTISALRFPGGPPATRLRPSLTTDNDIISDSDKKSSACLPRDKAEYYSAIAKKETDKLIKERYEEKAEYWQKVVDGRPVSSEEEVRCGFEHKWVPVDHVIYWRHQAEIASSPDVAAVCQRKMEQWRDIAVQERKAEEIVRVLTREDETFSSQIGKGDWCD